MNEPFASTIDSKNSIIKQKILGLCVNEGDFSIADISKEIGSSIPTITKLVGELIDEGFLDDMGKQDTGGGRRPSLYGLNPNAGYIVGVDIHKKSLSIAVTDFKGHNTYFKDGIDFILQSSESSIDQMCAIIRQHTGKAGINESKIRAYGFNITGRVNKEHGYCFEYFFGEGRTITDVLKERLKKPVYVDNDSRAMTYGEYICGVAGNESNMLFFNVTWGLGMGMITDGKLSYGKSGFSGEIGHMPILNNNQICQCGKIGCLETGASGSALHRIFLEKLASGRASLLADKYRNETEITLDDILEAIQKEDVLAIEAIEEIGFSLGKAIACMINIFNPELVVIGGEVASAKDYLLFPIKSAINKHSLNMINRDTTIKFSKLGRKTGAIGACMLSRSKLLGLV